MYVYWSKNESYVKTKKLLSKNKTLESENIVKIKLLRII